MILRHGLLEIRAAARQGDAARAADLADALHNLPARLDGAPLDVTRLRREFEVYQTKYRTAAPPRFDYVAALDGGGIAPSLNAPLSR